MNTNFSISTELLNEFRTEAQNFKPSKRFFQIQVDRSTESFVLVNNDADVERITDSFENDFVNIRKTIESPEKSCSYYLIWIGDYLEKSEESGLQNNWLLVLYNGSKASVKDRMLYAASLSIIPNEMGQQYFVDTYRIIDISELDNLSSFGYIPKSVRYLESRKFMTEKEMDNNIESKKISSSVSSSEVGGVSFPFGDGVEDALTRFRDNESGLLSLRLENEEFQMDTEDNNVEVSAITTILPTDAPRFVFYRYTHEHEGETQSPIFFIYNCPSKCKVSQRMIFSTSKAPLLATLSKMGLKPDHGIEITFPDDLTAEYLNLYAHPQNESTTFIKKRIAGPGRGKRRITE